MPKNSVLLDSLLFKPIPHTPIWLMRQAGRYLPEYKQIREKAGSFMNLCTNPELATKVTLQPLKRFNLDAAILFSDILVIPDALGLGLHFVENEGPKFTQPLSNTKDIDNLTLDRMLEHLDYVFATIRNVKSELNNSLPLIGFSGSPFTLACYMLEGGSSRDYLKTKELLYNNPEYGHKLLNLLSDAVIMYLNRQIENGVDVVMLFDSWGGVLSDNLYHQFSLPYIRKIINNLHKDYNDRIIPNIIFTKGGAIWLDSMADLGANAIGIDWTIDIGHAKNIVGNKTALQGNLDPAIMSVANKNIILQEVNRILDNYKQANEGKITGHVFNFGHGILPSANPDNVAYLIDIVHEISAKKLD